MAFPDAEHLERDPYFLGAWDAKSIENPKPARAESGFLFRIERDGVPRILVQSVQRPDWGYAFQNASALLEGKPIIREFEPNPEQGRRFRFRLLANVIQSKSEAHPSGAVRVTRSGRTMSRRKRTERPVYPGRYPEALQIIWRNGRKSWLLGGTPGADGLTVSGSPTALPSGKISRQCAWRQLPRLCRNPSRSQQCRSRARQRQAVQRWNI